MELIISAPASLRKVAIEKVFMMRLFSFSASACFLCALVLDVFVGFICCIVASAGFLFYVH